jgi:hypothetical protein
MRRRILLSTMMFSMFFIIVGSADAKDGTWRHSGSMYILTTPDGANLPASASEENFPLLVRLDKDFFDFTQAQTNGQDIRFSTASGAALCYQIEQWDASKGTASIWVRIPKIKGNARQEIKLRWGNPAAKSESNGKAVFDKSNGYLGVWHMSGPVTDEVGAIDSEDKGTTASDGMIGPARHFPGGKGVFCGKDITTFPTGSQPHSSAVWFRGEKQNCRVLSWGKEYAQGKVQMWYSSPSQIRMDCYFSDADVDSSPTIPLNKWVHVVHTYKKGESRIYVNGVLDAVAKTRATTLSLERPARMWIGGWYNNYDFVGNIDELRISGMTRSADWIKLQYENQKPMQTVTGILVQPGDALSVSPGKLSVTEGKSATVAAKAKGPQKLYWILKRDGKETILAVDRYSCTLDTGRVSGDESLTLQLKAVYPDGVKTRNVAVNITEAIPDPVFTLAAPVKWDGRKTIEITPKISNLDKIQAAGAGELKYNWSVSGMAVIKEITPGKLRLTRAQNSGKATITLTLSNGGGPVSSTATVMVKEPKQDPWVNRTPSENEKPEDNQFYARNDQNVGLLYCNGTLSKPADSLSLKIYADDKLIQTLNQKPTAKKAYAFTAKLQPGLIKYKAQLVSKAGGAETILHQAGNIVCGDAYLIDGQSNALATDTHEKSPLDTNEWIRSYARPRHYKEDKPENLWCNPVWKAGREHKAELGWWGMVLAKRLLKSQKVPIFIINGAVGGTRIDQHQRSKTDPVDLETIYGRMLWRVRRAKLTHGIRAVLWHQGENDQGAAGPDGDYGWKTYQQYFVDMSAAWKTDFPNIRRYYIFQIWPNSCSMGRGNGDMLREKQRTLPGLYSNMDIMSTLGIKPPGPAHFPLIGWAEFARMIQPLIERDFYDKTPAGSITPPNLRRAWYAGSAKDAISLEFDQPVVWNDSLIGEFRLDGATNKIASGSASGNVVTLKLKAASAARKISYLDEMSWSQEKLLIGKNGIAALTFCNVPILVKAPG